MRTALFLATLLASGAAWAGPPFVTDDPEPVEDGHLELYLAASAQHAHGEWSGTLPHFELNVGAAPDLQLHAIVPLAFSGSRFGPGDVELGAKFRFLHESREVPMVGVFPMLELATGDAGRGLGNGHPEAFLPLWLQKSFGPWTTYGGVGWRVSTDANSWFAGWLLQRRFVDRFAIGVEVFHESGDEGSTRFNVGAVVDLSEHHHLLVSAGRAFGREVPFQGYLAWQITLGPEEPLAGAAQSGPHVYDSGEDRTRKSP